MKESGNNVFSNGWMSVASIFTVAASLLVFGVFMILALNVNSMVGQVEKDYEIIVVVDENYTAEETERLGNSLELVPNVSKVSFVSNDERLIELQNDWGKDGDLLSGYQDANPLRDWYKVRCEDLTLFEETSNSIRQLSGVVKVIGNGDTVERLTATSDYLSRMSILIMIALGIVSVFIISNTIKLAVFSRRREINIMKYVGATDWFIRWPFIIEGMLIGLIGGAVSVFLVCLGYEGFSAFAATNIAFVQFVPLGNILAWFVFAFLFMGVVLGAMGSLIAVRKHLKV